MTEPSQHHAWIHPAKARYYQVHLDRDLFGDWTVSKVWGGIGSNRSRMSCNGVPSYAAGIALVNENARCRAPRGHRPVGSLLEQSHRHPTS
jgi:hypothetical protein